MGDLQGWSDALHHSMDNAIQLSNKKAIRQVKHRFQNIYSLATPTIWNPTLDLDEVSSL